MGSKTLSWLCGASLYLSALSLRASAPLVSAHELRDSYDVVIAGAGTGGFGTAVQAARLGATVLLLEETDWIGGQMTAAGVTSMDEGPRDPERGVLVRERGLYQEFANRVVAYYDKLGISAETAYWNARLGMEPRVGQEILYTMLAEAGTRTPALHVSLRSKVTRVLRQEQTVAGVVIEIETPGHKLSKTIRSRILVDATEWGDVIPLTGAKYRVGNCTGDSFDTNRAIQNLTWTACIKHYPRGVPPELWMTNPPPGYDKVHSKFLKSLVAGDTVNTSLKPWNYATFLGYRGMPNREQPQSRMFTRTHLNYNNDYPVRIGDVQNPGMRQQTCRQAMLHTLQLLYYIQHTLGETGWSVANDQGYDSPYNRAQVDEWLRKEPGLEPYRAILSHFAVMPYVRESRRIVGLHTLVAAEIERKPRSPKMFENAVALGDYAVDLHGSKTPALLELDLDHLGDIPHNTFGERGMGPFAIPFECLIPQELDGFLAAEKNISQSRLANGATRLQPSTMLIGQAAGAVAGLCLKYRVQPRKLEPVLVQQVLLETGDTLQITPLKDIAKSGWEWPCVQLVTVRGVMTLESGLFHPDTALTKEALARLMQILFKMKAEVPGPVTRGTFVRAVAPAMASCSVELDASNLEQAEQPVTRLEAARVTAAFLEKRALAAMTRQKQALSWPAPRARTPLTTVGTASGQQLARDLRILAANKIIDSPDYWLTHTVGKTNCDGGQVATLLKRAAKVLQPAADEAQFIETCGAAGLLNSPDYWRKTAVAGGQCSATHVSAVIRRLAARLGPTPTAGTR